MRIEHSILQNLLFQEEFARKVLPFLKEEYFQDMTEKIIFKELTGFFEEYNKPATKEVLNIQLANRKDLSESELEHAVEEVESYNPEEINLEWLLDQSEAFCKKQAVYLAIMSSIKIIDGREKNLSDDAIPKMLSDALAVTFDNHIGHDYIEDLDSRYEYYHRVEEKIKFDLEFFNRITRGGVNKKTLNVVMAGVGVGKSLFLCHAAAKQLELGFNVLYITLELAEEQVSKRIDVNLLDLTFDELELIEKTKLVRRMDGLKKKTQGKLIIKEYPTASAHVGHFRALIEELKMKKDFTPDIIYVDYLNICTSSRYKAGANINSYERVKAIAEELRGLGGEYNVPVFTATQFNRGGSTDSDPDMTDTSDSFGLPMTADLLFALVTSPELQALGQFMVKQLKNRYNPETTFQKFVIGVNKEKMRLFDVEESAQADILCEAMDNKPSKFEPRAKAKTSKFGEFNY